MYRTWNSTVTEAVAAATVVINFMTCALLDLHTIVTETAIYNHYNPE